MKSYNIHLAKGGEIANTVFIGEQDILSQMNPKVCNAFGKSITSFKHLSPVGEASPPSKYQMQKAFCQSVLMPCFVNENGKCPSCNKDIFILISDKEASETVITHCKWCQKSLVE